MSVLKLLRDCGKAHEGKPRSEPDWGKPTVRDRRGACGIVAVIGSRKVAHRDNRWRMPPDVTTVACAPHFYPDSRSR